MATNDKYNKKPIIYSDQDTDGESGQSGQGGGQSGGIAFHDFIGVGQHTRDDLLSPEEKKRLLSTHDFTHEGRVKQQKDRRDQYKALKEGKTSLKDYRQGLMGAGMNAQYRVNPALADKAQFAGVDRQVNALPNENAAETNNEKREELQLQYNLRHHPEYANTPKFVPPKPIPR